MLTKSRHQKQNRPAAALLILVAVVGCSSLPAGTTAPTPTLGPDQPAPTEVLASEAPTYAGGLGPRSWVAPVYSDEDETHISIARDLATDTVLRFPVGEQAVAALGGRVVTLQWGQDADSLGTTALRLVDAATGEELNVAVIQGFATSAAIRDNDVLFSIQGPGRDGGVWSLPFDAPDPVPLIAEGDLPAGSDADVGGRYLVWTSQSGRTVASDLVRSLDRMSLDVFEGQESPRRIDLPERANIIGLTDDVALVMNTDFIGAVDLETGDFVWRTEASAINDYFLTPDGQSVVVTLLPIDVPSPRPLVMSVVDLVSGKSTAVKEWPADEPFPTIWREVSTEHTIIVGEEGDLGDALYAGDWSATGTAIQLADGEVAGRMTVTVDPSPVP